MGEVGRLCEEGGVGKEVPFEGLAAPFAGEIFAAVVEKRMGEGVAGGDGRTRRGVRRRGYRR